MDKEVKKFLRSKEKYRVFKYRNKNKSPVLQFFQLSGIFALLRYVLFLFLKVFPIPPIYTWIYRLCGVRIGKNVFIGAGVIIDPLHPRLIDIGDNCTLGWGVRILTHEGYIKHFRVGRVKIGNNVVIGAFSTIRCGVTIGNNVIIAIGSVVHKDIPNNTVVGGVPIHEIKKLKKLF